MSCLPLSAMPNPFPSLTPELVRQHLARARAYRNPLPAQIRAALQTSRVNPAALGLKCRPGPP